MEDAKSRVLLTCSAVMRATKPIKLKGIADKAIDICAGKGFDVSTRAIAWVAMHVAGLIQPQHVWLLEVRPILQYCRQLCTRMAKEMAPSRPPFTQCVAPCAHRLTPCWCTTTAVLRPLHPHPSRPAGTTGGRARSVPRDRVLSRNPGAG